VNDPGKPISRAYDEIVPATASELARLLEKNSSGERRPLLPVGGRTALGFGFPIARESLEVSLGRLDQVLDFPARDMTVTVEAGCRMGILQEQLRQEGQRLPIDIPMAHRATAGGVVACNPGGPRRFGFGTMRDYVIGIGAVTAGGQPFRAGGRVVKNVAGYDLCKLLVGSGGSLAVISEVTFKLKPVAAASALGWACFDQGAMVNDLLTDMSTSQARPVAIELLGPKAARQISAESRQQLPEGPLLVGVGLEGSRAEVDWQAEVVERELRAGGANNVVWKEEAAAVAMWSALTEFQVGAESAVTFRASLRPSRTVEFMTAAIDAGVAVQAHLGNGVVHGHLPDDTLDVGRACSIIKSLRAVAVSGGGQVLIERCEPGWQPELDLWGTARGDWELMAALKKELDPGELLSPGRGIDGARASARPIETNEVGVGG
jgi:glycolate oxidase FAD binding subunit